MAGLVAAIHVFLATSQGVVPACAGMTELHLHHLIAKGFTGLPTAPVIGIAGATNMNS
jgi:hypothetical protein